jgi:hypothetical protein
VSVTLCGLVAALSVKVRVPAAAPVALGVNVTPTAQLAPAAMLPPQVLLDTANPALVTMLEKLSAPLSRFVTVTAFGELVLPTVSVPRFKLLLEKVTGALPVPVRLTVCVPAVSLKVSVPVAAPTAMGEKVTPTLQLAPAPTPEPQVLLAIAKPAVVPMPEKFMATLSWFVSVTVLGELVLPTTTVLKLKVVEERLTGALPVPARVTV